MLGLFFYDPTNGESANFDPPLIVRNRDSFFESHVFFYQLRCECVGFLTDQLHTLFRRVCRVEGCRPRSEFAHSSSDVRTKSVCRSHVESRQFCEHCSNRFTRRYLTVDVQVFSVQPFHDTRNKVLDVALRQQIAEPCPGQRQHYVEPFFNEESSQGPQKCEPETQPRIVHLQSRNHSHTLFESRLIR